VAQPYYASRAELNSACEGPDLADPDITHEEWTVGICALRISLATVLRQQATP